MNNIVIDVGGIVDHHCLNFYFCIIIRVELLNLWIIPLIQRHVITQISHLNHCW